MSKFAMCFLEHCHSTYGFCWYKNALNLSHVVYVKQVHYSDTILTIFCFISVFSIFVMNKILCPKYNNERVCVYLKKKEKENFFFFIEKEKNG